MFQTTMILKRKHNLNHHITFSFLLVWLLQVLDGLFYMYSALIAGESGHSKHCLNDYK